MRANVRLPPYVDSFVRLNGRSFGMRWTAFRREQKSARQTTRGHAGRGSARYQTWQHIRQRCLNPNSQNFRYYGGRGITVCGRRLNSFEAFLADMGEKPSGLTIDRIDNDRNYEPSNCMWATRLDHVHNRAPLKPMSPDHRAKDQQCLARPQAIGRAAREAAHILDAL